MQALGHNDTISAIATPMGQGGIAIVRVSGAESLAVARRLFRSSKAKFTDFTPWILHHGHVCDEKGAPIDDALVVYMPAPNTFTGEDVAEIQCHGGPAIVQAVLAATFACGARAAEAGEFTRRAFMNGRIDLTQAEAIAEMIAAPAREGARLAQARLDGVLGQRISALRQQMDDLRLQLCVAVDFPEDELECLSHEEFSQVISTALASINELTKNYERARCWREGALVVLAGQVNAGKSSLLNALLGRKRAIVTDVPGTTRDFLEENSNLDGLSVRLVDTAGLRETGDIVEQEGVRLSRDLAHQADLLLLVVDAARGVGVHEKELMQSAAPERLLVVVNKQETVSETALAALMAELADYSRIAISAKQAEGLEALCARMRQMILAKYGIETVEATQGDIAPNMRQSEALRRAAEELVALLDDIALCVPYDVLGVRLESVCAILTEITGESTPDEVLNRIFDSFCVGK